MKLGLEILAADPQLAKAWGRCGLLSNQASVNDQFVPAWQILRSALGDRLAALFGPQQGFYGTCQDNMVETGHDTHKPTGLPLYSLYSETRQPTEQMLKGLDTLVIDLPIVGCRVYTFKYSIAGCLRSAKKYDKRVIILDRPNPLGGESIEGLCLEPAVKSFVGEFSIPMRHGLTAGEAARLFNAEIGADLEVISLEGWRPWEMWDSLDRPWVLTTPNLPTPHSAYVYPGTVIFEGTNISEGRGTGLPFQLIGAPYIADSAALIKRIEELGAPLEGIVLREAQFEPTSAKWAKTVCRGLQIHVLQPEAVQSYALSLAILRGFIELGGEEFAWRQPPYEYNYDILPINLLIGSLHAADRLKARAFSLKDPVWYNGAAEYCQSVIPHLLYERKLKVLTPRVK